MLILRTQLEGGLSQGFHELLCTSIPDAIPSQVQASAPMPNIGERCEAMPRATKTHTLLLAQRAGAEYSLKAHHLASGMRNIRMIAVSSPSASEFLLPGSYQGIREYNPYIIDSHSPY